MKTMIAKLTSRKFWAAVAAFATAMATHRYDQAIYALLAYIGVEGAGDFVERKAKVKRIEHVVAGVVRNQALLPEE